jgi:hypothetical protein
MDVPSLPEHTHRFGEWKLYENENYYCENALYFRVCSGCNIIEWKDGSEADHNYVTVVTPPTCYSIGYTTKTCSKCGKSSVYNETAVVSHTYSTYSSYDSYHWKKCQFCDVKIEYAEQKKSMLLRQLESGPARLNSTCREIFQIILKNAGFST